MHNSKNKLNGLNLLAFLLLVGQYILEDLEIVQLMN